MKDREASADGGEASRAVRPLWKTLVRSISAAEITTFRNTAWLALGEAAYRGSRLALTVMLARYLGVEQFGTWSYAIALTALVGIVADFGLSTVTLRAVASERVKTAHYTANMLGVKTPLSLATLGLIGILGLTLASDGEELALLLLLGLAVVIMSYGELFHSIFRAHDRMELEAGVKMVLGAVLLGVAGAMMWSSATLVWFGVAYVIAGMVSVPLAAAVVHERFGKLGFGFDMDFWREALRASFPILLALIAFAAYFRIDLVMLQQISGDREAGLYGAAYNYVFPTAFVPTLLVAALFPTLSRHGDDPRQLSRYYLRWNLVMLAYAVGAFAVVVGTQTFVYLRLFGGEYEDSLTVIPTLMAAMGLFGLAHLGYFMMYARHREQTILVITIASLAMNVALNASLIPRFDMQGAAVATLATHVLVVVAVSWANRDLASLAYGRVLAVLRSRRPEP